MFFGGDGGISEGYLNNTDEVNTKYIIFVNMKEGDVMLIDNYKCMHGRNVFDGMRKHGVVLLEGWKE